MTIQNVKTRWSLTAFEPYQAKILPHWRMVMADLPCIIATCFIHMKSQFRTKLEHFSLRISVSCTIEECDNDNVTTLYYPISALLSAKWSLTGG